MDLEDELGDILEKARDGKRWSQVDLAKSTGISIEDIVRIEKLRVDSRGKGYF